MKNITLAITNIIHAIGKLNKVLNYITVVRRLRIDPETSSG